MAEERFKRLCDVCGGYDAHPRHVAGLSPGVSGAPDAAFVDSITPEATPRAIAELLDPTTTVRHMDCCASEGCTSCQEDLAVTGKLKGDKLLKALQKRSS